VSLAFVTTPLAAQLAIGQTGVANRPEQLRPSRRGADADQVDGHRYEQGAGFDQGHSSPGDTADIGCSVRTFLGGDADSSAPIADI